MQASVSRCHRVDIKNRMRLITILMMTAPSSTANSRIWGIDSCREVALKWYPSKTEIIGVNFVSDDYNLRTLHGRITRPDLWIKAPGGYSRGRIFVPESTLGDLADVERAMGEDNHMSIRVWARAECIRRVALQYRVACAELYRYLSEAGNLAVTLLNPAKTAEESMTRRKPFLEEISQNPIEVLAQARDSGVQLILELRRLICSVLQVS